MVLILNNILGVNTLKKNSDSSIKVFLRSLICTKDSTINCLTFGLTNWSAESGSRSGQIGKLANSWHSLCRVGDGRLKNSWFDTLLKHLRMKIFSFALIPLIFKKKQHSCMVCSNSRHWPQSNVDERPWNYSMDWIIWLRTKKDGSDPALEQLLCEQNAIDNSMKFALTVFNEAASVQTDIWNQCARL